MATEILRRRPSPPPTDKADEKSAATEGNVEGNCNSFGADDAERPSTIKVWLLASRPHTLTASFAPVIVGYHISHLLLSSSSSATSDDFSSDVIWPTSVAFASFACLIQLATNLHNDYADFVMGADDDRRVGQARATQRGWLTPRQTAGGSTVCLAAALAIGSSLTAIAAGGGALSSLSPATIRLDPTFAFVTLSSCFNAVAYTGGPYPLGYVGLGGVSIAYWGLGDTFAFLYFGLVATLGVPYLCLRLSGNREDVLPLLFERGEMMHAALLTALPVGFLATAIIVVNNLRDRHTDVGANKRTMAVRFGETFTRIEYGALVLGSYFMVTLLAREYDNRALLLPLLSFPVAISQLRAVAFGGKDGSALNDHVGGTARLQLLFCLLLAWGLKLSSQ